MGIKRSFGGASLRKPGAYSTTSVQRSGGSSLGSGVLLLIGEATTGKPGSSDGFQSFSAAGFADFIAKYTSGPLVDAALAALSPSKTPGVNGFDSLIVYKTNASTQASLQLVNGSAANLIQLLDKKWGLPGNYLTATVANGTNTATQKQITIKDRRNNITEILPQNAGQSQLLIQYVGAGSACTATITGASETAKTLATTVTAGPGGENLSINLSQYSMKDLVDYLNLFGGGGVYTATLVNTASGTGINATELDPISALNVRTSAQNLYRIQNELVEVINDNSLLVTATKNGINTGLPANISETYLTGGATGASPAANFSTALTKALAQDFNVMVPCISQDATADITAGLTDPSSTYVAATVAAAVVSHLQLRGNVKNRKEAQACVGFRNSAKASVYTEAAALGYGPMQLWMQDVQVVDINGDATWKQPHVGAAMLAGMRCGTPVGEPLTHKFLNVLGVGHAVNTTTGIAAGDFDPAVDFDAAIDAGVTFAESSTGGWRVCVDNTTYGVDDSFVWNRGSVVEAAQYIAKRLRASTELSFVGQKISGGTARSIKTLIKAEMLTLKDDEIVTPTDEFPLGYDEDNMVVQITGNAARVKVLVIPVQGLDFVEIEFTLGDIQQSA
jgi:hypothetical protein